MSDKRVLNVRDIVLMNIVAIVSIRDPECCSLWGGISSAVATCSTRSFCAIGIRLW
jgi:hypothetical protein